jgi:Raf kinase inhibitor-like YbhB/YbcL family protein
VRRLGVLPVALAVLAVTAVGCRDDGRELRPALPSQDGSVSTSAAPTVPVTEDDFFDTQATEQAPSTVADTISATAVPSTTAAPVSVLTVTAPWRDGSAIDARYTCKGEGIAPALSWTEAPEGTRQIAITMADLDFTSYDHWTLAGVTPDITNLAENATPEGAIAALNGAGAAGYSGPCPPVGSTHTYRITVHFLDRAVTVASGGAAGELRAAIDAATMATAEVTGTFTGS